MATTGNRNILIWIIVILAVTNISTVGTIFYHIHKQEIVLQKPDIRQAQAPDRRFGKLLREELKLTREQQAQFMKYRQQFHSRANVITDKMQVNRDEFMAELGKKNTDTAYLNELSIEIGQLHTDLKHLTYGYYLNMKNICNDDQQEKLFIVFNKMIRRDGRISMPRKRPGHFQK